MKKILIIDDHNLILEGIRSILEKKYLPEQIVTMAEGKKAVELLPETLFDVYIVDLDLKDMTGFELIKQIRHYHASARIIVNTMHEEIWNINRLAELNINGIVLKSSASEHLDQAIEKILDGKEYFCPRFTYLRSRNQTYNRRIKNKNSIPSTQERQVLKYIAQGYTTQEIANILSVSENTIESHRKSLFLKLEAKNVAHLVSIAINQGLLD